MDKPEWWDWPFDCDNVHLVDRMALRHFNEADLRDMIEHAVAWRPGEIATRFSIYARYDEVHWKMVVEPDPRAQVVAVVTAYTVEALP
ncbi:MAG TPA: hypothetical protein VF624_01960 [Tepidisphaeraceae bacterium]|jgi:hypothetical protein